MKRGFRPNRLSKLGLGLTSPEGPATECPPVGERRPLCVRPPSLHGEAIGAHRFELRPCRRSSSWAATTHLLSCNERANQLGRGGEITIRSYVLFGDDCPGGFLRGEDRLFKFLTDCKIRDHMGWRCSIKNCLPRGKCREELLARRSSPNLVGLRSRWT